MMVGIVGIKMKGERVKRDRERPCLCVGGGGLPGPGEGELAGLEETRYTRVERKVVWLGVMEHRWV